MLTLGLCGGSGSGKNAVGSVLSSCGFAVLDTDALYHAMTSGDTPLSREIIAHFGDAVRLPCGGVDRAVLSALVFGEEGEKKDKRVALNQISHRAVLHECRVWLGREEEKGTLVSVINAPLLFESGFGDECDLTVAVLAPEEIRLARIMERDGIEEAAALRRLRAQIGDEALTAMTDFQIHNDGSLAVLRKRTEELAEKIKKIAEDRTYGK